MKTTTIGACRWPPGAVAEVLGGGALDGDCGGAEPTEIPELPLLPPAHPAHTAASTHRMSAAGPRTRRSVAVGDWAAVGPAASEGCEPSRGACGRSPTTGPTGSARSTIR
jgi:hypothetical protein